MGMINHCAVCGRYTYVDLVPQPDGSLAWLCRRCRKPNKDTTKGDAE